MESKDHQLQAGNPSKFYTKFSILWHTKKAWNEMMMDFHGCMLVNIQRTIKKLMESSNH